jgi:PAS domain S-box-containing protein
MKPIKLSQPIHDELTELEQQHPGAMVVLLDMAGRYRYVNRACRALLGYGPEEMLGHIATDYAAPDDIPHVRLVLEDAILNGESVTVSIHVRTKAGELRPARGAIRHLSDPETDEGYLMGWVAAL